MAQEPPPYTPPTRRRHPRSNIALPGYPAVSASASTDSHSTLGTFRCQHRYSLETSKGRPWVTLTVHSRSPNSNLLPLFFERDIISGSISLDLAKPDSIRSINISIQAGTTALGQQQEVFLETSQTIWSQPSGKLQGFHSWTFSISIPTTVSLPEPRNPQPRVFHLPPRFSERGGLVHIDYKISVTVKRGMLAVNSTLGTNFVYLPKSVAEAPSALRALAYRQGTALIAPHGDPEGWKVLPEVETNGNLFGSRPVSLAVATPLCYATNTSIPLHMTLRSADQVAVDFLSSPQVIIVRLVRTVAINDNSMLRASNSFDDFLGRAVFWTIEEQSSQPGKKALWGELHLRKGLKPSFVFQKISLRYTISLYPPQASGFVLSSSPHQPLASQEVRVALMNPPGIRCRSYAPPGLIEEHDTEYSGSPTAPAHIAISLGRAGDQLF
ncbi:hypothetical protein EW146_g4934 [Bondarzewia mesenterica]|uniref:Arrestin-like N-terminal domain-containing protein n=1 Tax=Bondarzewia mesenterica TaxID=1095465 RepID=A0A4S4LT09_9AGAM|nr:hypothetical protein EW146_g4934 [Bondarzewia mesenterica]